MDKTQVTIPEVLHHWATHEPDTAAFIFVDSDMRRRVLSRSDVYRFASRFAAILRRNDVKSGDIICNTLPNSPERVVTDLGIIIAGAAAMNGQIFLADGEDFIGSLRDSECKAVILDPLERRGAAFVLSKLENEQTSDGRVHFPELPALRTLLECCLESRGGQPSFLDTLEDEQETFVADVTPDDLAYIMSTSGSTGFSKLLPHTHARVCNFARNFAAACGIPRKRVFAETTTTGLPLGDDRKNGIRLAADTNSVAKERNGDDDDIQRKDQDDANADDDYFPNDSISRQGGETEDEKNTSDPSVERQAKDKNSSQKRQANGTNSSEKHQAKDTNRNQDTLYANYVYFNNGRLGWSGGFPAEFLWYGATRVLLDLSRGPPEDPVAFSVALAMREGCHYAFLLPFHLQQWLSREELWRGSDFKFKVIGLAGQPVHKSLLQHPALTSLCQSVNVFYGSTDLGDLTCNFAVDPDAYEDGNNGKPFPGVELKIVDEELREIAQGRKLGEELREIPQGRELGEVLVRSDMSFTYYLSNEDATKKTILPDGWCRSGDVGYISEEGDLFVICRSSFAIMRGAYVVYPGWLENRIKHHPAVREVFVVPVPDPVLHQELCACVVTHPEAEVTVEDLRAFCEALFLTERNDHMTPVPRYFLFFSDFPTTATGKPCRRSTAATAVSRLLQSGATPTD